MIEYYKTTFTTCVSYVCANKRLQICILQRSTYLRQRVLTKYIRLDIALSCVLQKRRPRCNYFASARQSPTCNTPSVVGQRSDALHNEDSLN